MFRPRRRRGAARGASGAGIWNRAHAVVATEVLSLSCARSPGRELKRRKNLYDSQSNRPGRNVVRRRHDVDAAFAASRQTVATADRGVRQLVRVMDKDENGVVSKEEFMEFMGRTFDRIDETAIPRAVLRDCVHRAFPECSGGN